MRTLRLIGLSADTRQVVFTDDAGVEYSAPADDRLRAALRGDRARLGQLEIDMDSALRPRDIQARIRSGETPEGVAALAGVPIERIMAYCVPVLAERRHVAEMAGRSHVRRTGVDGPARRLDEVVAERLRGRGITPDTADWDAWRRDDGRWSVEVSYRSGEQAHAATFVFDQAGRYSVADDDEAKWLTGEEQHTRKGPQPRETGNAAARRLSSVPSGDDLLTLSEAQVDLDGWIDRMPPAATPDEDTTPVPTEADAAPADASTSWGDDEDTDDLGELEAGGADGDGSFLESVFAHADYDDNAETDDQSHVAAGQSDFGDVETSDDLTAVVRAVRETGTDAPPTQRRRRTHATVPSWDEIMLGGRRRDR
jgi:hypothetical protein